MAFDQLANPFRQEPEGSRRAPPPPVGPREWARLYVMAVVFLMAVALSIYFAKVSTKPKKEDKKAGEVDYSVRRDPLQGTEKAPPGPEKGPPEKKTLELPPLPQEEIASFKELAAPFRDGEEKLVKETPEFVNLLQIFLKKVTPEQLSRKVRPDLNADKAYLDPARSRGEVIRAYGRLIYIFTEPINATLPENIEYVYLGIMQEYRSNRTVWFYLPELPKDPATGQLIKFDRYMKRGQVFYKDWVEVHGVFLRNYDYEGASWEEDESKKIVTKAPILFARTLTISRGPQATDTKSFFTVVVGGAAVIIVAIVLVAGIMSRKYGSGSLRMKMHHLRKDKGIGDFPKPDPAKQVLGDEIPKPSTADPNAPPAP